MTNIKRRNFNKLIAGSVAVVPLSGLLSSPSRADDAAMVDPESPTAKGVRYAIDTPEEGKNCAGCVLYVAEPDMEAGKCAIFPGSLVPVNAWCSAYVQKPS